MLLITWQFRVSLVIQVKLEALWVSLADRQWHAGRFAGIPEKPCGTRRGLYRFGPVLAAVATLGIGQCREHGGGGEVSRADCAQADAILSRNCRLSEFHLALR